MSSAAPHAVGQQIKLLLAVLLHGHKGSGFRGDALLFAQKHGQFFGQFAGIKEAVEVGAKHTAR